MISLNRLVVDGWVQLGLGVLAFLLWYLGWYAWVPVVLWGLWLWQTGSALELWLDYQHHTRKPFLWLAPALLVAGIWARPGLWLLLGGIIAYAGFTLRDYLVVRRRPRSFWDL